MPEFSLRDTFGESLVEYGSQNEDIVVLDADLSSSTRTYKFAEKFPNRFFNFGIAEQNMVGAAMGFAISRKIPIVSGFAIFTIGRAWEFIRMACHDNLNIKFVTTHAGFVGEDGSSHNALEDLSIMASLPNLNILVPCDSAELRSMLKYAINKDGPYYIRLPRSSLTQIHKQNYNYSKNQIDVIKNGKDLCIIGTGYGTSFANENLDKLTQKYDISIKLINLSTVKPIPIEKLLNELKDIDKVLVIEEHNLYCGVSSILARYFSLRSPKLIKSIGIHNTFGESGKREKILENYGFSYRNIEEKIAKILNRK
ncbi:MAG: transketolase family protein [Candidatus Lokiarchaeota archaeon]|nr:transketolase family protein [Candidatus Lokiarchaeota archaeon]